MIEKMGYDVCKANNGKAAIEIFRENYEAIDLVVLDMIMPQMSGGELFDALKGIDPDCNVLLSSGYNIDGEARKIMDRGCRGFIQKPFGIENLSNQIRTIIGGN